MGFEELRNLQPGECVVFVRHKDTVIGVQGIARLWTYSEHVDYVDVWLDPFDVHRIPAERSAELQLDMLVRKVVASTVNWDDIYDEDPVLPRPRLGDGT